MADRSILFSNFNSPEAENPGDFESSYNVNAISSIGNASSGIFSAKIDQAREKFEEAKTNRPAVSNKTKN